MKRIIKLRERELRQIIAESVRRVLNEKWYQEILEMFYIPAYQGNLQIGGDKK